MPDIHHLVQIAAPPQRVFKALTEVREVRRWWTPDAVLDIGAGGRGRFGFYGGQAVTEVEIACWEPPRQLTWRVVRSFRSERWGTEIVFNLVGDAASCVLRFSHCGFPDAGEVFAMTNSGWGIYLQRLKAVCEGAASEAPLILHSVPGSPFGRAVLSVLEEKAVDYRLDPLAPDALKTQPHLSRHPFGKAPALTHGDFGLYETQAILRYLDRICPEPALTPPGVQQAARMDQLMNINDWYVFQGVVNVIGYERVIKPVLFGLAADEAAVAHALPAALDLSRVLDGFLLGGPYLVGEAPTLADFLIVCQLDFLTQAPEWAQLTEAAPRLAPYVARMSDRPAMRATTWKKVSEMAAAAAAA